MQSIFFGTSIRTRKDDAKYTPIVHESRPAAEPVELGGIQRWRALVPRVNGRALQYVPGSDHETRRQALEDSARMAAQVGWMATREDANTYARLECRAREIGRLKLDGPNRTAIPEGITRQDFVIRLLATV